MRNEALHFYSELYTFATFFDGFFLEQNKTFFSTALLYLIRPGKYARQCINLCAQIFRSKH